MESGIPSVFPPGIPRGKLRFPCECFISRVVLQVTLESTFGIQGVVARGLFKSGQLHKGLDRVCRTELQVSVIENVRHRHVGDALFLGANIWIVPLFPIEVVDLCP
jgi:hypothetical protein